MLAAAAHTVAVLIEAAGSALLVGFVLAAGGALLRGGGGLNGRGCWWPRARSWP